MVVASDIRGMLLVLRVRVRVVVDALDIRGMLLVLGLGSGLW